MPWTSDKQRRWGNSPAGIKALGQAKVDEFNRASKGMNLEETAKSQMTKKRGKRKMPMDKLDAVKMKYMSKGLKK